MPKIESNSLGANQACCRFSSTVAPPQQPNQSAPAIPNVQAKNRRTKRGWHACSRRDWRPSTRVGHRGLVDVARWLDARRVAGVPSV